MDINDNMNPEQESAQSPADAFDTFLANGGQAEFDRRLSGALESARLNWDAERAEELTEAQKMERMSATERARYQLDKDRKELDREKAEFQREKLKTAVGAEMNKRGLPAALATYLTGETAEESMETLSAFENAFNSAVQERVNQSLRGTYTPREAEQHPRFTKERLRGMSAAEINEHWAEVSAALKGM